MKNGNLHHRPREAGIAQKHALPHYLTGCNSIRTRAPD